MRKLVCSLLVIILLFLSITPVAFASAKTSTDDAVNVIVTSDTLKLTNQEKDQYYEMMDLLVEKLYSADEKDISEIIKKVTQHNPAYGSTASYKSDFDAYFKKHLGGTIFSVANWKKVREKSGTSYQGWCSGVFGEGIVINGNLISLINNYIRQVVKCDKNGNITRTYKVD